MNIKIKTVNQISVGDFDKLVMKTYGRPYSLQQQDGCKPRGIEEITVPNLDAEDYEYDTVSDLNEMGVSFNAWLERNPKQNVNDSQYRLSFFWERSFYPDLSVLANDLHQKGLLPAGTYQIVIDW